MKKHEKIQLTDNISIQEVTSYQGTMRGQIQIMTYGFNMAEMSKALTKANELGWEWNGVSYETGYYESVDYIWIEVSKQVKS